MVSKPRWRAQSKRPRRGLARLQFVDRIEEIELRFFGLMVLVEKLVLPDANATNHLAVPVSQEEIRLGMFEEGMLLAVQRQVGIHEERRHPLRAALVKIVIELDKLLDLLLVLSIHLSIVSMLVSWGGSNYWRQVYNTYGIYSCDTGNGKNYTVGCPKKGSPLREMGKM